MACTGMNGNFASDNLEDKTVRLVYADAPPASKIAFKRLWLADAVVAISINAFEKFVDALDGFLVSCLPIGIFSPGTVVPYFLHATALRRLLA